MGSHEMPYISTSDPMWEKCTSLIGASYPNSCIISVQRIINSILEAGFEERRRKIREKRGFEPKVLTLFHGTRSKENAEIIAAEGFLCKKNVTSAYGKGTYFAVEARYSSGYMGDEDIGHMFVCDVLVGEVVHGVRNMRIDTEKYDNAVDRLDKPTMYVVPYNKGGIPRYLVTFHRTAR